MATTGVKRSECHSDSASPVMEAKKRMFTPPPSGMESQGDLDSQSPRTDASWPSDEEMNEMSLELKRVDSSSSVASTGRKSSAAAGKAAAKHRASDAFSTEGLNADAIKQHKAQRRREQVRAASRRCRDRQRKETEDLRTKVFQLEEYIAHTLQAHEWEQQQQRERVNSLQHENDLLVQQLAMATASGNSNASVSSTYPACSIELEPVALGSLIESDDDTLPDDLVHYIVNDEPTQWSSELVYHAVDDTSRQLVTMLESQVQPVKSPVIFGWQFDFWAEGDKYFGRNRKFFPGVGALELGKRMQHVEPQRYMETFPEVHKMDILQVLDENVLVMRLVKALPGKVMAQSVNARFLASTTPPAGSTSRWVYADRTIDEPTDGEYALENECNGYIFEDTIEEMEDGSRVEGCMVQGVGAFESGGMACSVLIEELSKAFSSVVIRWEGLFINDYMPEDADGFADIVLDF
ncbi:hypothetical protein BBJ28_00008578 [Nothophytophthora sp. Chile5]|nr:hypothetical protein BBJ28_00008578 [Nothophytophthora sp. Chile5]